MVRVGRWTPPAAAQVEEREATLGSVVCLSRGLVRSVGCVRVWPELSIRKRGFRAIALEHELSFIPPARRTCDCVSD